MKKRKKKRKFKHIIKVERSEISILFRKGYSLRDIAKTLKRNVSSISREIKYNTTNEGYSPAKANHKAYVKRKYSKYQGMKVVENLSLRTYIEEYIREDWSPEEISGRIKNKDRHIKYISPKGIYKFIYSVYGRQLEKYLAYQGKFGKRKNTQKVTKLEDRIFIDKRPKIVEKRRRFGDWEGDFIVSGKSGKGVLLVLHERKARYVLIKKILNYTISNVHQFIFDMTGGVCINTLTLDNDIIFRKHKLLSHIIGVPIYFCHPYHSWEKGGVENTNKLIRRYIPKGADISQYSDEYIQMIQDKLNARPRKCLKYKTPYEVMMKRRQFKNIQMSWSMYNEIISTKQKAPVLQLRG